MRKHTRLLPHRMCLLLLMLVQHLRVRGSPAARVDFFSVAPEAVIQTFL